MIFSFSKKSKDIFLEESNRDVDLVEITFNTVRKQEKRRNSPMWKTRGKM